MTPRKELFIKVRDQLKTIPELEMIDLFRNQFAGEDWTAALIRISSINWGTMTQKVQEGDCTVDIIFYCRDGWMDQFAGTGDDEGGLIEIDVIDAIVDTVQFLKGEQFSPLEQSDEETEEQEMQGVMSYRIAFETKVYRDLEKKYSARKLTLTP